MNTKDTLTNELKDPNFREGTLASAQAVFQLQARPPFAEVEDLIEDLILVATSEGPGPAGQQQRAAMFAAKLMSAYNAYAEPGDIDEARDKNTDAANRPMAAVVIKVHETDGLNATDRIIHIDTPPSQQVVGGPRQVVLDHESWAVVAEAVEHLARTVARVRPMTQSIKFKFHVPA